MPREPQFRARHEFTQKVKYILAQRVGLLCSNPICMTDTTGPQTDPSCIINVGAAAHITAAAPGGPRFNPELSEKERAGAKNGIWLRQTCAKLIDSDLAVYSPHLLLEWEGAGGTRCPGTFRKDQVPDNLTQKGGCRTKTRPANAR